MTSPFVRRAPPGGAPLPLARVLRRRPAAECAGALERGLRGLLGGEDAAIGFHASGREAMRVVLAELARRGGRTEVVVPAYTCYSVPAAAVAAGLRVRLVDVDDRARIDLDALARLPLERAAAVVVCNLFGVPEPCAPVVALARAAGCGVIDDAAQSLGATGSDGAVGARGDVGVLSFARGKPLSALGGGALVWCSAGREEAPAAPPPEPPRRWKALARACAYDLALSPRIFPWLAAAPLLGVGETRYETDFSRGSLDGASLHLAAALVDHVAASGRARAEAAERLAARIAGETDHAPLVADPGDRGVYPRLAVLAADASVRDATIEALGNAGVGASGMYPASLDRVAALAGDLVGSAECPGARELAARLLTIAPPRDPSEAALSAVVRALGG